ncbi:MAG: helix-turn-helix domain-containing protein [Pirellulales bacterium]|nr:helix-turn-helix domain-containing protein [Pirellulales bacterium]
MKDKFSRTSRAFTSDERETHDQVRREAREVYPATESTQGPSARGRIAIAIRSARQAHGWSFDDLATRAGLPHGDAVRDIEYGSDAKLSDIAAIASALGLHMELVADSI